MSGPAAARAAGGPLNSALGQWAVLGLGAYVVAGPDKAGELFRGGMSLAMNIFGDAATSGNNRRAPHAQQQPIVIHSSSAPAQTASKLGAALRIFLGAGLLWGSYALLTSIPWIPDSIKAALPVTRALFERAVSTLAASITAVHDTLSSQISALATGQDDLAARQDATLGEVEAARSDLAELRGDADDVRGALGRCEESLGRADRRTSYAARGVELLVRALRAVLPAEAAAALVEELEEFARSAPPEEEEGDGGNKGDVESGRGGSMRPDGEGSARRGTLSGQERTSGRDRPPSQSPVVTPLPRRPSRLLERMDSVPERTDHERTGAQAPAPVAYYSSTTRDVDGDGLGEVRTRSLFNSSGRRSFKQ